MQICLLRRLLNVRVLKQKHTPQEIPHLKGIQIIT